MTQARPVGFDPQRRAARPDLRASIETFARHLESEERRLEIRSRSRRDLDQRNFRLAVEAIACNLLVTAMIAPDATLSVPRSHAAMWSRGRYDTPVYGQHFLDILDLLAKLKLVEKITRGYRYSQKASQPTTVRANRTLSRYVPLGTTDWNAFHRAECPLCGVALIRPREPLCKRRATAPTGLAANVLGFSWPRLSRSAAFKTASASASVKPLVRNLRGFPSLMVTPSAGFVSIFPFDLAQPNTVLSAAKSLSFTVFAEMG